jgi:hypothetical protein
MVLTLFPDAFAYSAFPRSALISTGLQPGAELVPWRPNPVLFASTRAGSREVASTSGPVVMTVFPVQSGAGVTVVMLPPLSA